MGKSSVSSSAIHACRRSASYQAWCLSGLCPPCHCLFSLLDLPARYISGYIETEAPPGHRKLMGVDASHAWVSFFCRGIGWIELDPTIGCIPSMRHIKIGYGRDYADVSPVSGILIGGGRGPWRFWWMLKLWPSQTNRKSKQTNLFESTDGNAPVT